jgi:hypothetical protein
MPVLLIEVHEDPAVCGRFAGGLFGLLVVARRRGYGDMRQVLRRAGPAELTAPQ